MGNNIINRSKKHKKSISECETYLNIINMEKNLKKTITSKDLTSLKKTIVK